MCRRQRHRMILATRLAWAIRTTGLPMWQGIVHSLHTPGQ
jgi:hypothetical protein